MSIHEDTPMPASSVVGGKVVTPMMAFRVARLAKVSVDDVLAGLFPAPGTCPHCGQFTSSP